MTKYEQDYVDLLNRVMYRAHDYYRGNRTKSSSIMRFGESITIDLNDTFPILIGRKMYPKTFFTELKWFIEGETNIKRFKDAGIKIWDKWADENGELGPVYGHQLRKFGSTDREPEAGFDQLLHVLWKLKHTPKDRRIVVSLWNPKEIYKMNLPPCYHSFTFSIVHERLNCHVTMRSSDVFVGLPYDIALFATMLHLICATDDLKISPGLLHFSLTDAHIYRSNMDPITKYLDDMNDGYQTPNILPQLINLNNKSILSFAPEDLKIVDYNPKNSYKVEVVE